MDPMATSACSLPTTWSSLSEAEAHLILPHPDMASLLLKEEMQESVFGTSKNGTTMRTRPQGSSGLGGLASVTPDAAITQ